MRFQADPADGNAIAIRTDDPDQTYFLLELGLSSQSPYGISGFFDWQMMESYDNIWIQDYSFGVRFETSFGARPTQRGGPGIGLSRRAVP